VKGTLAVLALAGGAGVLIARGNLWIGLREFSGAGLEQVRSRGERLTMLIVGVARFDSDITPELVAATVNRLVVVGLLEAGVDARQGLRQKCMLVGAHDW